MRHLARALESSGMELIAARGAYLFGPRRRKVLDFTAGWSVGNLGWGRPEIEKAVRRFDGPDYVLPSFEYKPWERLASLLTREAPGRLEKCFRATGGTEAVDIAMRAAMAATGRRRFVAIEGCYHGDSAATMSLAGKNAVVPCVRISPPLDVRALRRVETALKGRDVAAFVMEPVICNLAVLVPSREFMKGLQKLCRKYGALLILDEVACGFGRTGKLFATEHFGLEPDLLCLGKALTGGVEGAGATLATAKAARDLGEDGGYYSTYGWHPRATAAALANVGYLLKHRRALETRAGELGAYFRRRLRGMDFEREAEVRQLGLACGVVFEEDGYAEKVAERCLEAGLLISAEEKSFTLFPPLNIPKDVAASGLAILERCL